MYFGLVNRLDSGSVVMCEITAVFPLSSMNKYRPHKTNDIFACQISVSRDRELNYEAVLLYSFNNQTQNCFSCETKQNFLLHIAIYTLGSCAQFFFSSRWKPAAYQLVLKTKLQRTTVVHRQPKKTEEWTRSSLKMKQHLALLEHYNSLISCQHNARHNKLLLTL